jgi:hypothetical protein
MAQRVAWIRATRYDNEKVFPHSEEFVTDEGVHINQVECLWSLVNP